MQFCTLLCCVVQFKHLKLVWKLMDNILAENYQYFFFLHFIYRSHILFLLYKSVEVQRGNTEVGRYNSAVILWHTCSQSPTSREKIRHNSPLWEPPDPNFLWTLVFTLEKTELQSFKYILPDMSCDHSDLRGHVRKCTEECWRCRCLKGFDGWGEPSKPSKACLWTSRGVGVIF